MCATLHIIETNQNISDNVRGVKPFDIKICFRIKLVLRFILLIELVIQRRCRLDAYSVIVIFRVTSEDNNE